MSDSIVAWWSGGITSAVACSIALREHDDVDLVHIALPKDHHEDMYRFKADCEKWYGHEIREVHSEKYSGVDDVIERDRYINGPSGARCSMVLKKWVRETIQDAMEYSAHIMGFEFEVTEIERAIKFKKDFGNINPLFPLIDHKLNKAECAGILLSQGIALPVMYQLGFHNNNCIGCVKGGMGYWNKVREHFPGVFAKRARQERAINASCINGVFLDELDPAAGRHEPPIAPECGPFCGESGPSIYTDRAKSIFAGQLQMELA